MAVDGLESCPSLDFYSKNGHYSMHSINILFIVRVVKIAACQPPSNHPHFGVPVVNLCLTEIIFSIKTLQAESLAVNLFHSNLMFLQRYECF